MDFQFSKDQIRELLEGNADSNEWFEVMRDLLPKYGINTPRRVAGFVAQCMHESMNFTVLSENLNYSSSALDKVFPKYFVRAGRDASDYHRQPEKIANVIYAGRMGNGNTDSGDGWRYRGRGIIQLTGKNNYSAFAESVGMSLDEVIDYLQTKKGAMESACWYWDSRNINDDADDGDIIAMTRKINGGTIGLDDRRKHYEHALEILTNDWTPSYSVLRQGSTGQDVVRMQKALGIVADGIFGPGTERMLQRWQLENNLVADGIAGPATLKKLYG